MNDHVYLSTACFHEHHVYCKATIGILGEKRPAECKFCDSKCICECHKEEEEEEG